VHVALAAALAPLPVPQPWVMTRTLQSGEPWLLCARDSGRYVLRFVDLADFEIDLDGRRVLCVPAPGLPAETVRHLLLDQVFPLLLVLRGREVLHASAVETSLGVCAFAGSTGSGKSTLASSFLAAGCPVLSDDCLIVDEAGGNIFVTPSYPGVRLWGDSVEALAVTDGCHGAVAHYTSKRRVVPPDRAATFPTVPRVLSRVYLLARAAADDRGSSGRPVVERMSPRDGLMALVTSTFRLDLTDRERLLRQFDFLQRVVERVPVRRLRVPPSFEALPAARDAVLADLEAG
jgi:hypothetical protein